MALSTSSIVASLQDTFGPEVTTGDIRGWCAMNDISYQTVTKKLNEFKVGRGKCTLTVKEKRTPN